jgi:hypothetical protein
MTLQTAQFLYTYLTPKQFIEKNQAFTNGGLRSLIFNEHTNGLSKSGAIIRLGRKRLAEPHRQAVAVMF